MGGMWIWWILVLVVIVVVVARVAGAGRRGSPAQTESPEEILKRRYAAGEITEDEYERRMREIRK